jgi:2-polyprenyl-6-methoxyphenol hydroxylase-like FAD-dependent oxidoreductase
VDASKK